MQDLYEITNQFNGYNIVFLDAITVLSVIFGILIIVTKNPVISVLFLIFLFSNISLYLIMITIVFLGLSYLLVYVGAVSILFLFILMLINIRVSELVSDTNNNIPLAILVLLYFYTPISGILPQSGKSYINEFFYNSDKQISYVSSISWDSNLMDVSDITSIGNVMYTSHFMWLIITSIILLLAMVGSILITIKQTDNA